MILKNKHVALNIANSVTSNQCANIILAAGGSPIMSNSKEDIKDLINISKSLTINIGTANEAQAKLMIFAFDLAKAKDIPIILDPVGSGASVFRTNLSRTLARKKPAIIRGNASEIFSLIDETKSHGVDSNIKNVEVEELKEISKLFNSTLLITGSKDYIIQNNKLRIMEGGSNDMTLTTGLGCMLTSLVGAFATEIKPFEACLLASKIMKNIGENLYRNTIPGYNDIYNFIINYE